MTFTKDDADRLRRLHERVGETGDLNGDIRFAELCLILVPRAPDALAEAWGVINDLVAFGLGWTGPGAVEAMEKAEHILEQAGYYAAEEEGVNDDIHEGWPEGDEKTT